MAHMPRLVKPTIERVLAGFEATLRDLEAVIEENAKRININRAQIGQLMAENEDLGNDNRRAARVIENINELIQE